MSTSLDLSTTLLWQSLTKDVYVYGMQDRARAGPEPILEANEDAPTSPLLVKKGKVKHPKGAGWLMTSFLIVNTALGIGVLNFPAAYDQAGGIFFATGIQVVLVCLMMSTMLILAHCSDVKGDKTYHDVLLTMCGKEGQQLAAFTISLTLYCVCVATLIIIGDQMDSLFYTIFGPEFCQHWYLSRQFTIPTMSILFVLPCCFCKRVDFLAVFSSVGIFVMLYPVFLTVYGYFELDLPPPPIKRWPDSIASMLAVVPVLGLGYQCQEVVVPVYSCMRERNLCNFIRSSVLSMLFLFTIYSVTGCFGYLTFGQHVENNVMKMYNASDPVVMIGVGALILKMVVSYPILALCGRDALIGLYAELRKLGPSEFVANERIRRYVFAVLWFTSSLLLAVLTSGIGVVIKYLGSVASVNIFIYPGICLMKVALLKDPGLDSVKSLFLTIYGILIAGLGAFCVGVVLFEAILSSSNESVVHMCG